MSDDFHAKLALVRTDIDALDAQLLDLLNRRAKCAERVGQIKAEQGESGFVYRPEREAQVLRGVQQNNQGPLPNDKLTLIFREIMSACLSLERPLKVAFLGPAGTFSESAAIKHFGRAAQYLPQTSIDAVFRAVDTDGLEACDYGLVPIENSTGGAIGRTLDLLTVSTLQICGEVTLRIHQNLLSNESSLATVAKVYSHPQSLAQCHEWLNQYLPNAERIPAVSNAQAAQQAATEAGSAAIAGEAARERYQLAQLASGIEDEPNNTTRFVVLGRHQTRPSGRDKTSLIMSLKNQSGALFALLSVFSDAGISMTRLESRPARHTLWDYVFFVDLEGHCQDEALAKALVELEKRAAWVKILGAYPFAVY